MFSSTVSFMASNISLFSSSNWDSTAPCVFASESILFKKVSTGFSKAMTHVIPQRVKVAAALPKKYGIGVMACSFSLINGYIWRSVIWLLKNRTETDSTKCITARNVRELEIHTARPFLAKRNPHVLSVQHKDFRILIFNIIFRNHIYVKKRT